MFPEWKQADHVLQHVNVIGNRNNEPVTVTGGVPGLRCIGIGTDAAVFRYEKLPAYAYKVYTADAIQKKDVEAHVYARLAGSRFFPQCYGAGNNYLALSFERGYTLYECLLRGIPVPEQVMIDVEQAREFVRARKLNPRDIHLKNVLLQEGRAKIVDVSEYVKDGNDYRWEHLMWAYERFYPFIQGAKVHSFILNTISYWYKLLW